MSDNVMSIVHGDANRGLDAPVHPAIAGQMAAAAVRTLIEVLVKERSEATTDVIVVETEIESDCTTYRARWVQR